MKTCDHCDRPITWLVFAAHDLGSGMNVARYPAPFARACDLAHAEVSIAADQTAPVAPTRYVLALVTTGDIPAGAAGDV